MTLKKNSKWGFVIRSTYRGGQSEQLDLLFKITVVTPLPTPIIKYTGKKIILTIMQFLNTTNKYETSKASSSCNKNGPPPPKAMEI